MNKIIVNDISEILSSELVDWSRFYGKTVLITGANGMLPAYLVFTLIGLNNRITEEKNKVNIIALVRNIEKAQVKFKDFICNTHFSIMVQDVCDEICIKGPVDFVIHAASQASPKYYGVDPVGTINANILGTLNTLNLAKEKNSESYLFFSSNEIYGIIDPSKMPFSESDYGYVNLTHIRSCYCESKRMGEQLCIAYNYQYNIPTKIIRIFHTYGPGMLFDDGRVFADFTKNILDGKNIVMHSDGSAMRSFCYVTDAIIAYLKVLLDGKNANAYNICNINAEISIKNLAETLVDLYPEKKLKVIVDIDENDMRTGKMKSPIPRSLPSCDKIKDLGWIPKIGIKEGFKRTIDSFIE